MANIKLTINGKEVKTRQGATILEAAREADIYIPTLCYHPSLAPYGGCRMCIVEVEKMRGLPPSCTTPATDGMVVHTETPQLQELRRNILELILTEHPHACLTCWRKSRCHPWEICLRNAAVTERCVLCSKNYRCELQQVSDYVGIKEVRLPYSYRNLPIERDSPFFDRDYNLCILCGRCVRVCQEIRGRGAIAFTYRGSQALVGTAFGITLKEAGSEFCGACVDACPTGALMDRSNKYIVEPDRTVTTTCIYCGVGCSLKMEIKGEKIVRVIPDPEGVVNKGQACVKGRFGIPEVVHHPSRLSQPLVRKNGKLEEASWEEALNVVAEGLGKYRGDQVAVLASAKCTNEDNYVLQKFARTVLATNNVDHCARL